MMNTIKIQINKYYIDIKTIMKSNETNHMSIIKLTCIYFYNICVCVYVYIYIQYILVYNLYYILTDLYLYFIYKSNIFFMYVCVFIYTL